MAQSSKHFSGELLTWGTDPWQLAYLASHPFVDQQLEQSVIRFAVNSVALGTIVSNDQIENNSSRLALTFIR